MEISALVNLFKNGMNKDSKLRVVHIGGIAKKADVVLGVINAIMDLILTRRYNVNVNFL